MQHQADGIAPITAEATMLQEAVPRPVPKKFPVVPFLVGVLAIGIIVGAAVEHEPLIRLVAGTGATASAAPNTGGSGKPGPTNAAPTPSPTPSPTPTPVTLVTIPNVTCATAAVAQQTIEAAGFRFAGSFVANPFYPNGVVFKTQPLAGGQAPQGSEITAFVLTGPPQGIVLQNQCANILRVISPNLFKLLPTPTRTP